MEKEDQALKKRGHAPVGCGIAAAMVCRRQLSVLRGWFVGRAGGGHGTKAGVSRVGSHRCAPVAAREGGGRAHGRRAQASPSRERAFPACTVGNGAAWHLAPAGPCPWGMHGQLPRLFASRITSYPLQIPRPQGDPCSALPGKPITRADTCIAWA